MKCDVCGKDDGLFIKGDNIIKYTCPECARKQRLLDPVSHPAHYTTGNIEVIDYIEDKGLNYHLGNAVKYISRAGRKNPDKYKEDLLKAIWYLQREVDRNGK